MRKLLILLLCLLLCGCRHSLQDPIWLNQVGPLEDTLAEALEQAGYPVIREYPAPGSGHSLMLTQEDLAYETQAPSPALLPSAWDLNKDGQVACVLVGEGTGFWETLPCENDRAAAHAACAELLARLGKDAEVLLCTDVQITLGALDAIRDNGRTVGRDIYLVGMGSDRQLPLLVRSGDLSAVLMADTAQATEQVLARVIATLEGREIPSPAPVPLLLITADTVEDYL